mmetsp:Transcript_21159/g.66352  ORF Transcript_21159/g.66352 Transcript_21159/m.66352 type:complete len:296 (-) Transcript_21159:141-1028(-)
MLVAVDQCLRLAERGQQLTTATHGPELPAKCAEEVDHLGSRGKRNKGVREALHLLLGELIQTAMEQRGPALFDLLLGNLQYLAGGTAFHDDVDIAVGLLPTLQDLTHAALRPHLELRRLQHSREAAPAARRRDAAQHLNVAGFEQLEPVARTRAEVPGPHGEERQLTQAALRVEGGRLHPELTPLGLISGVPHHPSHLCSSARIHLQVRGPPYAGGRLTAEGARRLGPIPCPHGADQAVAVRTSWPCHRLTKQPVTDSTPLLCVRGGSRHPELRPPLCCAVFCKRLRPASLVRLL